MGEKRNLVDDVMMWGVPKSGKPWICLLDFPIFGVRNALTQMEFTTQESELDLLQSRQSSVAMPVGSVQILGLVKIRLCLKMEDAPQSVAV